MNRTFILLSLFTLLLAGGLASAALPTHAAPTSDYYNWERITLDSQHDVGSFLSLAGHYGATAPTIAYYDATAKDLKLARPLPGNCGPNQSWTCEILDSTSSTDVGQWVSLAFNGAEYGVVYYDAFFGVNRYTAPAKGIFGEVIELVSGASVGTVNALVYSDGTPHVAYYRDVANQRFGFAERVGSNGNCSTAWQCTTIAPTGGSFSIDAGLYSGLGLSYSSSSAGLAYAHPVPSGGNCGSGAWQCETVYANALATATSFRMARCGLLSCSSPSQIAYYDYLLGGLIYAERVENGQGNCVGNLNWKCAFIEFAGLPLDPIAPGLSLVVDGNNQPVILYQDFIEDGYPNTVVKAAWPSADGNCGPTQNWQCVIVDTGYRAGAFLDVGASLDAELVDNRIFAAYYEAGNGDLVLAYEPAPAETPTPTATPSVTITPTATPSSTPPSPADPEHVYLPVVKK